MRAFADYMPLESLKDYMYVNKHYILQFKGNINGYILLFLENRYNKFLDGLWNNSFYLSFNEMKELVLNLKYNKDANFLFNFLFNHTTAYKIKDNKKYKILNKIQKGKIVNMFISRYLMD